MKFVVIITIIASLAAASPIASANEALGEQNDALSKQQDNKCTECVQYCSDPTNGSALGAACYVVKCGIVLLRNQSSQTSFTLIKTSKPLLN